jgi:hypothetical protein
MRQRGHSSFKEDGDEIAQRQRSPTPAGGECRNQIKSMKSKIISTMRRAGVPVDRIVRLFTWPAWDCSTNLHLTPTVTFWRHHDDDWDGDCLLKVRREVRLGVEWMFWAKSWRVWRREWKGQDARNRF